MDGATDIMAAGFQVGSVTMRHGTGLSAFLILWFLGVSAQALAAQVHNVILFVPDGLRASKVTAASAVTMAAIRDGGVNFYASHSLFPTFTTANASAFATGHLLGDTGDFSNTIYTGFPVKAAGGSVTPFLESDTILAEVNEHFGGNYLDEVSLLAAARKNQLQTAAIGKLGPAAIQDLTSDSQGLTLIVDDRTGQLDGPPLSEWRSAFDRAGVAVVAPSRGENGNQGDFKTPGTKVVNLDQQNYSIRHCHQGRAAPGSRNRRPFFLVYSSRDPDGITTQPRRQSGQAHPRHKWDHLLSSNQERRR